VRIDFFLKTVGLFKARSEAKRALETGRVVAGGEPLEPSHPVVSGEEWSIRTATRSFRVLVLEVPSGKSVPRSERSRYIEIHEDPL